jgi:hypothetical protein
MKKARYTTDVVLCIRSLRSDGVAVNGSGRSTSNNHLVIEKSGIPDEKL